MRIETLPAVPSARQPAGASRLGFTLIELLVVVAIVAVLAAILFPVFATAREKARQSMCLSNTRQIGMALTMYLQDSDEVTPAVYELEPGNRLFDALPLLSPYIKNKQLLFCPDRNEKVCGAADGTADVWISNQPCYGYGYNWGPIMNYYNGYFSGGLLSRFVYLPAGAGVAVQGIPLSAVTATASTYAFGDTRDTPWASISATTGLSAFSGSRNSQLAHGGRYNMVFLDGHCKSELWHGGFSPLSTGGGRVILPSDPAHYGYWCTNPDAPMATTFGTMACKNVGGAVAASVTKWFGN